MIFVGYNIAHWIFGFKYFKISRVMIYFIKSQRVPPSRRQKDEKINTVFIWLNFAVALAATAANFMWLQEIRDQNAKAINFWSKLYATLKICVGLLDVISAGFLCAGIWGIHETAKKTGQGRIDDRIDIPQLVLHFSTFGLYLASLLTLYIFYVIYIWTDKADEAKKAEALQNYYLAVAISNWINFIAQILLVWILWPLTVEQPPQ